jgi:putative DNA primase/helicase
MSYADAVTDFLQAMETHGISPVEPIAHRLSSGDLIRFRCEGDGKGRKNGWAVLYLDEYPAGAFGNYRLGRTSKWRANERGSLSTAERERLQHEWREAQARRTAERAASAQEASLDAAELWAAAGPVDPSHGYVARKTLSDIGLRQHGSNLLVPMFDRHAELRNLQRIRPDGSKRFLKGGETDGLFFIIGRFRRAGERCCIGEGLSTMHAVHAAAGCPAIVAFSQKNLMAVSRLWHAARPDLDLIICGDDDAHLVDNPQIGRNLGRDTAHAVAQAIGARIAMPPRLAA